MKVLLIITSMVTHTIKTPHLGIGYIAACLEKEGYEVAILDEQIEKCSHNEIVNIIKERGYGAVGLTSTSENRFHTIRLIKSIRKVFKGLIFVGGHHFTYTAKDALENIKEIDVVVRGEGEFATLELMEAYSNNREFYHIKGITFRDKDNEIIETEDRPLLKNLDLLPQVAWHLFQLKKYKTKPSDLGLSYIGVMSSRGCHYNCVFCAIKTKSVSLRSPELFVDELEYLHDRYNPKAFQFFDSTFTINRSHCESICEEIIKRKLDIKWVAKARINNVDESLLSLMKEAGCYKVLYGIESGSERISKRINKNITISQIKKAINVSLKAGLKVTGYFMVSLPDETLEDLKQTVDLMTELIKNEGVTTTYAYTLIYPGTELERIALKERILPDNFSWNRYRIFPKCFITDSVKTIPYYENPNLKVGRIKLFIFMNKYIYSRGSWKLSLKTMFEMFMRIFNRVFKQVS